MKYQDTAQIGTIVIIIAWDYCRSNAIGDCFGLLRSASQCLATTCWSDWFGLLSACFARTAILRALRELLCKCVEWRVRRASAVVAALHAFSLISGCPSRGMGDFVVKIICYSDLFGLRIAL